MQLVKINKNNSINKNKRKMKKCLPQKIDNSNNVYPSNSEDENKFYYGIS